MVNPMSIDAVEFIDFPEGRVLTVMVKGIRYQVEENETDVLLQIDEQISMSDNALQTLKKNSQIFGG
jgi:hypothetical protein